MNKTQAFLALALAAAAINTHADMNAVDRVPAATLLLPYFEVEPTNATGTKTVMTIGNSGATETVAHVVLWTDAGVPTINFDVRLPAKGVSEIDLGALFATGARPQSTAGGFGSCSALPPAPLSAADLTGLRNAHSGVASTLLGNQCGGFNRGDTTARGYVTVDAASACSTATPTTAGYFVAGGTGIATNNNVLWGEYSIHNSGANYAQGDALVHIEADSANPATDGAGDYTFYGRLLNGSGADNRERLPGNWMAGYAKQGLIANTRAVIWRDPGLVPAFACGTPPSLRYSEVIAFDDAEEPYAGATPLRPTAATQALDFSNSSQANIPFARGEVVYNLNLDAPRLPFDESNQAFVAHAFVGASGQAGQTSGVAVTDSNYILDGFGGIGQPDCADGRDNDGDGLADFPADTNCQNANQQTERPQCSDGIDNDGTGGTDFPADTGCASAFSETEAPQCSDGFNNGDPDGLVDFPADPECTSNSDPSESANPQCSDGIDNDADGRIDYSNDPECEELLDTSEAPAPTPACSDGIDNDNDGQTDLSDANCLVPSDTSETGGTCLDGLDNDSDGRTDLDDYGCTSINGSEGGNPECSDGVDNSDVDTLIDYPADPGCAGPRSETERPACDNAFDDDGDMQIDFPADTSCFAAWSDFENDGECGDSIDNDGDGLTDFPADTGCLSATDPTERTGTGTGPFGGVGQCGDGLDNDADGIADYPRDPNCTSLEDESEFVDCADGFDNDSDGTVDFAGNNPDAGCASAADNNERAGETEHACSDGIDNDSDNLIDFPLDGGCDSTADDVEFRVGEGTVVIAPSEPIPASSALALALIALGIGVFGMFAVRRRQA